MKRTALVGIVVLGWAVALWAADPSMTREFSVGAWPYQVYGSLTSDWQLKQWTGASSVTSDDRPGGPWRLTYPEGRIEEGLFTATDRPRHVAYSVMMGGTATQVSVNMARLGDSTKVMIAHSWPDSLSLKDSVSAYWDTYLPLLKLYLNNLPGGYVAIPRGSGPFPGVLVIHDRFGLNRMTRMRCDSLASIGYIAVAPDMFRGEVTGDKKQAATYVAAVADSEAVTAARTGLSFIKNRPDLDPKKLAVWGFGYGGQIALSIATEEPRLRAVAIWRDSARPKDELLNRISCPVLAIFGDYDLERPRAEITGFDQAMIQHGIRCETVILPSVKDFGDPAYGEGYSQNATNTALDKTFSFLDTNLRK